MHYPPSLHFRQLAGPCSISPCLGTEGSSASARVYSSLPPSYPSSRTLLRDTPSRLSFPTTTLCTLSRMSHLCVPRAPCTPLCYLLPSVPSAKMETPAKQGDSISRRNEIPHTGWLKEQKSIVSQFWCPQGWFLLWLLSPWLAVCYFLVVPLHGFPSIYCVSVLISFLEGHQSYWIRMYSKDSTLT